MNFFHRKPFQLVAALFALFIFTGDLVADAVCDATGACASENSQQPGNDGPCCACAVHAGAAVMFHPPVLLMPSAVSLAPIVMIEEEAASGVPVAIDHPPQLG